MNSVTMKADSTQDGSKDRERPQAKKRKKSVVKKKAKKPKISIKKGTRRASHGNEASDDSGSESDLDLKKELKPIISYVRNRDEMVQQMFSTIRANKVKAMLPEILKSLSTQELKRLCQEQLQVMSRKRIQKILQGADPDGISSSGTDDDSTDEEKKTSGRHKVRHESRAADSTSNASIDHATGLTVQSDGANTGSLTTSVMVDDGESMDVDHSSQSPHIVRAVAQPGSPEEGEVIDEGQAEDSYHDNKEGSDKDGETKTVDSLDLDLEAEGLEEECSDSEELSNCPQEQSEDNEDLEEQAEEPGEQSDSSGDQDEVGMEQDEDSDDQGEQDDDSEEEVESAAEHVESLEEHDEDLNEETWSTGEQEGSGELSEVIESAVMQDTEQEVEAIPEVVNVKTKHVSLKRRPPVRQQEPTVELELFVSKRKSPVRKQECTVKQGPSVKLRAIPTAHQSPSQQQTPVVQQQLPTALVRQTTAAVRQTSAPVRQSAAPVRQVAFAVRQPAGPAKQLSAPIRQNLMPVTQQPGHSLPQPNKKAVRLKRPKPKEINPADGPETLMNPSSSSVPILSRTQMEILELEMRARAIKAMLKKHKT